jgi:hypothetical protein
MRGELFTKEKRNLYANDIAIEFGQWLCNRKVILTNQGKEPEGYLEGVGFIGTFNMRSLFCHFIRETRNENYSFQDWANHEINKPIKNK